MNTPTHILVACALLTRRAAINSHENPPLSQNGSLANWRTHNRIVFAGALLPDISIYIFFVWSQLFTNADFQTIWGELYWTEPWQTFSAFSNSIPLMVVLAVAGWRFNKPLLLVIALAMLSHVALDLPFHADDAHKHFWPISHFRFHSPFSYWDNDHHSGWVSILELFILIIASTVLWRRFKTRWVRAAIIIAPLLQLAGLLFFYLSSS